MRLNATRQDSEIIGLAGYASYTWLSLSFGPLLPLTPAPSLGLLYASLNPYLR